MLCFAMTRRIIALNVGSCGSPADCIVGSVHLFSILGVNVNSCT